MEIKLKEINAYKSSIELGNILWDIVAGWDDIKRMTAGEHLINAIDSVGANIAKAFGRYTYRDDNLFKEGKRYCYTAGGSLEEAIHWIRIATMREFFTPEELEKITPLIESLPKKLDAYIQGFGKSAK